MKSPETPPLGKPLSTQSCIIPEDMPKNEFEWFDFMAQENKIAIGDRKFERFPEDADGNILLPSEEINNLLKSK